jgi:hypothetical protein
MGAKEVGMRSIVTMSVLMGLALLLVEGSANAALVEIKVPFAFQVENQTLPAVPFASRPGGSRSRAARSGHRLQ